MANILLLIFGGLALLATGAELLVRGSSRLAALFGISPLVIGLTIVACGTSAPELAVSLKASFANEPDLVTGNCIGSTIFNVLFILGACALISPLIVVQQLIWLDVPVMIGAHFLLLATCLDGMIGRWDALLLLSCFVGYIIFIIRKSRKETAAVKAEYQSAFGKPDERSALMIFKQIACIVAALVLCVFGSRWMVDGSILLAKAWGVSELVIGLTIVAAGTSMPEVATSIAATLRGQRDIAIGNVVGSNLFNILGILGFVGLTAPDGIAVAPSVLSFDLPVAIATCVACLPIFFTGHKITRWEGAVFLAYYIAYTCYLVLAAKHHDALPMFHRAMLWFAIPLTLLTFAIVLYRSLRSKQSI